MRVATQHHDFFQAQRGSHAHGSGLQRGWVGHSCCTATGNSILRCPLHWVPQHLCPAPGRCGISLGETWDSRLTARAVLSPRLPQVNVGRGSRNIPIKRNRQRQKAWKEENNKGRAEGRAEGKKRSMEKCRAGGGSSFAETGRGEQSGPSGSYRDVQEEET